MKWRISSVTNISHILIAFICLFIAVFAPTVRFTVLYRHMAATIGTEMAFTARTVERIITQNPKFWQFENTRLLEILEERLDPDDLDNRMITDLQGNVIAAIRKPLSWPVVVFSQTIFDSGLVVARLQFERSITPLVKHVAIIGTGSTLLGVLIFLLFYFFPLRTVREAYDRLQENEHRLSLALKSGHFGIMDWDIKRNAIVWDDRMYEIYGLSRHASGISLEAWQNCISREDRARFLEEIKPENIAEKGQHMEFRIVKPDGELKHINADGIVLRDEEGKPARMIGLHRDVTQRRLLEERLEQRTDAMESAIDGIAVLDEKELYVYLNKAHALIYGYGDAAELVGKTWRMLYDADELERFEQEIMPIFRQKGYWRGEAIGTKADGSRFPQEVSLTGLHFGGLICVVRDTTERKHAENIIRKSEERYRTIFENTATANVIVSEDSTIIMVNDDFVDLSGYTKQELKEKNQWMDFIHEDDLERMQNYARQWMIDPALVPSSREFRFINRKGEVRELFLRAALIPGTTETILSLIDLTDMKQLETQLAQSQRMETVGHLAGGIAHVFNNMLGVIIGNAELALHRLASSDPLRQSMDHILSAAKRSADLTRELLAYARKQNISPKVLDLNDALTGLHKELRKLISETLKLLWLPGHDVWPVRIDPSQLEQIMTHLTVNASDDANKAGKIIIETTNTSCDEAFCSSHPGCIPGEYVLLTVSDDGCGMDREALANIFEPFFTTHKNGLKTNLGLATVYGIVKQNNGFIYAYSEPELGTTVRIYLPRFEAKNMAA